MTDRSWYVFFSNLARNAGAGTSVEPEPGTETRSVAADTTQTATDGILLCDTTDIDETDTTLAAAIADDTATAVVLVDGEDTVDGTYIQVGSEVMRVVSGGGTETLEVERGALDTTAAAHSIATGVQISGALTVQLLAAAAVPNRYLVVRKTTPDLSYVRIVPHEDDEFPGGGAWKYLPSNTEAEGTMLIVFPDE